MCGIAGIFAFGDAAPAPDREELLRIREAMARRGPDGAGLWRSPGGRVALAHRRLAIIDVSDSGAQPMASADGRLVVTFNGEIYNYRELRRQLHDAGRVLRSQSDTEVLLHLYALYGADMVHKLRGMYAFAIWDADKQAIFMARDPFGIKPLYYANDGGTFRFASQVKALLAGGGIDTAPEPAGAAGFMLWGCVPEPFTLYRDIHALPAGMRLTLHRGSGGPVVERYFDIREELLAAQEQARTFTENDRASLGELLRDAVRHHLVSDVPVGVFLSAGVDSTLVASFAAEQAGRSLRTLTLGFEEYRGSSQDEVPVAEKTARALEARHETHWIRRDDFEADLQAILDAMDQPTTDGVNSWFVSRATARSGLKVALSGLGGDELFGGYPSFRHVPRMARWLRLAAYIPAVGRIARSAVAPLISLFTSPKFAGLLEYGGSYPGAYLLRRALFMPWEISEALDPVTVHTGLDRLRTLSTLGRCIEGIRGSHARVAALELGWYMKNQLLRDADWAGMAHSVEVRVPFIDVALFRALAPWMVSSRAPEKADAAAALRKPLEEEVLARAKSGFSVPVRDWQMSMAGAESGARGLRNWARRLLPPRKPQFRALVLVTEAYGGHGGIAKFNRDLVDALARMPECAEAVVLPRLLPGSLSALPGNVRYVTAASGGKARFAMTAIGEGISGPFDLVVVGHINLSTLGWALAMARRARSVMVIHGIDAWTAHPSPWVRRVLPRMDRVIGVSNLTLQRFQSWSRAEPARFRLLPNCVDMQRFSPAPPPPELAAQLGVQGCKIIMTFGRLASEERYKGFDEVLESLPEVLREVPNLRYLVCGDGPDRVRLEAKARALRLREHVIFVGYVPEHAKPDYYRLADAYIMPSRGEGFGIVFLEAMSCGLPAVGSSVDGSREALLDGVLGALVDPDDKAELQRQIVRAVRTPKVVPPELRRYSSQAFQKLAMELLREAMGPDEAPAGTSRSYARRKNA